MAWALGPAGPGPTGRVGGADRLGLHDGPVAPRLPSLDGSIRTFASGGAAAHAAADTREAFALAAKLGADGIESVVRLSADGVPVLHTEGRIGGRLRRRRLSSITSDDLPEEIVSLADLHREIEGDEWPLLLLLPDTRAFEPVVEAARRAGPGAEERLWLCSADLEALVTWRQHTTARLINSVQLSNLDRSPEQWAAGLRERGIDGLGLPHREWSGGLVTLLHRFERLTVAHDAVHERELAAVVDAGIDGVSSRHVDRMAAVVELYYPAG